MKVRILKTNKVEEFNDCYAIRLIEQGKAIAAVKEPEKIKMADPPKPLKGKKTKGGK